MDEKTFNHYLQEEDDKGYFTKNSLAYYYEDMTSKEKLIKELAKYIADYDKKQDVQLGTIEEKVAAELSKWDSKVEELPETVNGLLTKWVDDGILTHVIDTALIDQKVAPLTAQLVEKESDLFYSSLNNHKSRKRYITIFDDDARPHFLNTLLGLALKYNIPITSAVITGNVGDNTKSMTLAQLKDIQQKGIELVSHTVTHPRLADIPLEQVETELKQSSEWMIANGFDGRTTIAYPFGSQNETVRKIARKYYDSAFDIDANVGQPLTPPMDTYKLDRIAFNLEDGTNQVARAKEKIDVAKTANGWVVLMTHCFYDGFSVSQLEEVIQYALSQGFEFVTVKKGLKHFSNLIDIENKFGAFTIDADGNGIPFQEISSLASQSFKIDTPLSDYPKGKSAYIMYQGHPGFSGFPEAGIVETYNSSVNYNYQELITYTGRQTYRRYWENNAWTLFLKTSNAHNMKATNVTAISSFPMGINICSVITADSAGLPYNTAGTLVTYKSSPSNLYNYQTFKAYGKEELFKRHVKTDGTWGNWIGEKQGEVVSLTLSGGWTGTLEVSRTHDGQVWLRGMITSGTTTPLTTISTVPYGYRSGNYYKTLSVYNFTQLKPMSDVLYLSSTGELKIAVTGIGVNEQIRFSELYQTTEV